MLKNNEKAKKEKIKIWKKYLEAKTEKDYTTLYIHIPYCSQKCNYCEYYSKITKNGIQEHYIDYLEEQFKEVAPFFENEPIKALNFGGGTPNMLSPKQLDRILVMIYKYWNLDINWENEMGFEFNPANFSDEHIDVLKNSYINRLSMGVQTFDKNILKKENRLYSSKEKILDIYNKCKGFSRMTNVDLLAGLYNQTSEILIDDVRTLLNMDIEMITIYELNRIGIRLNKESSKKNIKNMLLDVYNELSDYSNYRYVGTTHKKFEHCNRFYKLINTFEFPYNPSPQGFNSIIGFSIDDDIKIHPYSHFTPINKAYERINKNIVNFYNIDKVIFKSSWKEGIKKRNIT